MREMEIVNSLGKMPVAFCQCGSAKDSLAKGHKLVVD